MKRILVLGIIASTLVLVAYGVITLYDYNLTVGRMWETPAIKPHENPIPFMEPGSVPVTGGEALYRAANATELQPSVILSDPVIIAAGKIAYRRYCFQCHGPNFDGYGTVGQSFAPPPRDLRSVKVQSQPVGGMFKEISYGIPGGRQPALATTMTLDERWHVIAYVKSLGARD
jgi:mono/diheme cytochrome c family protein